MSAQLSLYGAGMCELPSVVRVEGESLAFVLNNIPSVGRAKGTSREGQLRPVAELYRREAPTRPDLAGGDVWVREKSTRPAIEFPRADIRRAAKTHGDAKWWLTLLRSDFAEVVDFSDRIESGLVATGVKLQTMPQRGRLSGALLNSLDALVIAMCWEPATAAGCFLASAVEPLGDQWRVLVDQAQASALPWASRLAELSEVHGPLVRAWRWVHETRQFDGFEECDMCGGYGMVNGYENNVQDCPDDCWQGMARKWQ